MVQPPNQPMNPTSWPSGYPTINPSSYPPPRYQPQYLGGGGRQVWEAEIQRKGGGGDGAEHAVEFVRVIADTATEVLEILTSSLGALGTAFILWRLKPLRKLFSELPIGDEAIDLIRWTTTRQDEIIRRAYPIAKRTARTLGRDLTNEELERVLDAANMWDLSADSDLEMYAELFEALLDMGAHKFTQQSFESLDDLPNKLFKFYLSIPTTNGMFDSKQVTIKAPTVRSAVMLLLQQGYPHEWVKNVEIVPDESFGEFAEYVYDYPPGYNIGVVDLWRVVVDVGGDKVDGLFQTFSPGTTDLVREGLRYTLDALFKVVGRSVRIVNITLESKGVAEGRVAEGALGGAGIIWKLQDYFEDLGFSVGNIFTEPLDTPHGTHGIHNMSVWGLIANKPIVKPKDKPTKSTVRSRRRLPALSPKRRRQRYNEPTDLPSSTIHSFGGIIDMLLESQSPAEVIESIKRLWIKGKLTTQDKNELIRMLRKMEMEHGSQPSGESSMAEASDVPGDYGLTNRFVIEHTQIDPDGYLVFDRYAAITLIVQELLRMGYREPSSLVGKELRGVSREILNKLRSDFPKSNMTHLSVSEIVNSIDDFIEEDSWGKSSMTEWHLFARDDRERSERRKRAIETTHATLEIAKTQAGRRTLGAGAIIAGWRGLRNKRARRVAGRVARTVVKGGWRLIR